MPSLVASAQTSTSPAFFSGVWACPDSVEIQLPGQLPGSLHQALIRENVIPDPFKGTNEEKVQWVGEKSWVFNSDPFKSEESMDFLTVASVQLYSRWFLNGALIGETDNAFRAYEFDLRQALNVSNNVLSVEFTPPLELEKEKKIEVKHPLPGNESRAVHRMPQFAFGWDWGPKLLDFSVMGLSYKEEGPSIKNVNLKTIELYENKAKCLVQWELDGSQDLSSSMRWALTNEAGAKVAWGSTNGGAGDYSQEFDIEFPELWWTHDLGIPYLYNLEIIAFNNSGLIGRSIKQVGIRTLELNTKNDAFQFVLNGQPIYAMGSNVVPCDIIPNRINPREERSIIDAAIEANMNMLRVWGGGLYASDNFMDYCDAKGILVWHDFMFACAMYPGNEEYLHSVREEVKYQTQRLRHHPSLAIWCGNNEVSEGWERWGWKNGLSESEVDAVSDSYHELFNELLPNAVTKYDDAPYWESSPMLGRGDSNFKNVGDAHDWGIWHDGYAFDSLWSRVPRFMSEYGFQSFPANSTFNSILSQDSIMLLKDFRTHPEIMAHEKHPRGFDIIDSYMERTHGALMCDSMSFEDWAYLSRVIQADGIAEGAIAGRLSPNHCTGTLVWQLNDCWPVASWSSIDGHGRWKLLHNKLERAFDTVLLNGRWKGGLPANQNSILEVGLVANNGAFDGVKKGILVVDVVSLNGDIVKTEVLKLELTAGEATIVELHGLLLPGSRPENTVIHLRWNEQAEEYGRLSAEDRVYCVIPGNLALEKGSIYIERFGWIGESYLFEISSNTYVKDVELRSLSEGNFSENGFDLFPGEKIRVEFKTYDVDTFAPGKGASNMPGDPHILARSLNDFIIK